MRPNILASELQTHGVAAFMSDDLIVLLAAGADPHEMQALFAPGFAAEGMEAHLWSANTWSANASRLSARSWQKRGGVIRSRRAHRRCAGCAAAR